MKTSITLSEIKSLNKEEFLDICIPYAYPEQWENQDAYEYAIENAERIISEYNYEIMQGTRDGEKASGKCSCPTCNSDNAYGVWE